MASAFDPAAEDFIWLLRHVSPLPESSGHADFDIDTAAQVLDEAARFIADRIAPLAEASDTIGARLENGRVVTAPGWRAAYTEWCEAGWQGLAAPQQYGGMGAPAPVQAAVTAMLAAADLSFAMLPGGSRACAALLAAHADEATKTLCLPKLASGEWAATIAMTEAQAGTDAGLIRTKAVPLGGGAYALSGTKIFISNGDHDLTEQILHVTLARISGAPEGTRGLSLFLVPARKMDADGTPGAPNGVRALSLEHKTGLSGSPTCVLEFDSAEATLIGAENSGLAVLFAMLNEMRLDVGLSAAGLAASAASHARAYAQERRQGKAEGVSGPAPIAAHPDVRRMLSIMAALTEGGRALAMETARQIVMAEEGDAEAARLAALLTPVCKAGLSEMAFTVASMGVQVFGGHGYIRESGAERFLREARVLSLYEGANGVQAADLAMRKLRKDGGAGFAALDARIAADLARLAGRGEAAAIHVALETARTELAGAAQAVLAAPEDAQALAAAWPFLELTAHTCLCWMWLLMAGADAPADSVLARKQALARFFAAYYGGEAVMLGKRVNALLAAPDVFPPPA